jgi:hypothetical protein
MPRSKGGGNADTLQQRARWFGYKADYLGYCRVFLSSENEELYREYVEHEENMRGELKTHISSGQSLQDWKRTFLLHDAMNPTRKGVIGIETQRGNFSKTWFQPTFPQKDEEITKTNLAVLDAYIKKNQTFFKENSGSSLRTEEQKHFVSESLKLSDVYELLTTIKWPTPQDSQAYTGLLIQLASVLRKNADAQCSVFLMKKGKIRERSIDEHGGIVKLFQGSNATTGYPRDSKIRSKDHVTIQIHFISLKGTTYSRVPVIAVILPKGSSWIVQG